MASHKSRLRDSKGFLRIGSYEIVIFLFLLLESSVLTSENNLGFWEKTYYLITYEFGLVSRALIGSVFSLFTDRVTDKMIYLSALISFLILIIMISLLLGGFIRKSKPEMKNPTTIFAILFLASPFSVTYLLGLHIGRFDTYWIIITLLALVFLKNPVLKWSIPFLCAIAMSIHQGYMITYMPALAIPMLYEIYKNKYSKTSFAIFSLSCLTMIAFFIAFQFFPANIPFDNAIDFANYLSQNSSFRASAPQLYMEYFSPFVESRLGDNIPLLKTFALPLGLTYLLFSLPLLIIFGFIWKRSFNLADNRFKKFVFSLCAMAPLVFIPAATLGLDWDRWWAAVINTQFVLIFYFVYSNEISVVKPIKAIASFFERHLLVLLLIVIFMSILTFSEATTNMFSFITNRDDFMRHRVDFFNEHLYYFDKKDYWYIMGH